ncbi:MAG: malate dehydrogenase [Nitrospira sp.]|nr:malate dehydrogenase [bacterium]MBL7049232.1 malate dehydrogenase [Nitrospira sp.]
MNKKITVVGAGNVGTTTAQLIAEKGLGDVVLIDIMEGIPQGKALDILEACPVWGSSSKVTGTNSYQDTAGSDIVVITAGLARKPGMSRDDLLFANTDIMKQVAASVAEASPEAIIIVVTNPMDAMAQVVQKVTGFPRERVIGMGGVLDTSRMRSFIAMESGAHPKDIHAVVLGGHGDLMVPVRSLTTVKGEHISKVLSDDVINAIIERTKGGGAEIVGLLKTGSAYYAPAASSVEMIETILGLKKELLPCAVYLEGEYGISGVYVGAPVQLGAGGLEKVVQLELTDDEQKALHASADSVRGLIEKIGI